MQLKIKKIKKKIKPAKRKIPKELVKEIKKAIKVFEEIDFKKRVKENLKLNDKEAKEYINKHLANALLFYKFTQQFSATIGYIYKNLNAEEFEEIIVRRKFNIIKKKMSLIDEKLKEKKIETEQKDLKHLDIEIKNEIKKLDKIFKLLKNIESLNTYYKELKEIIRKILENDKFNANGYIKKIEKIAKEMGKIEVYKIYNALLINAMDSYVRIKFHKDYLEGNSNLKLIMDKKEVKRTIEELKIIPSCLHELGHYLFYSNLRDMEFYLKNKENYFKTKEFIEKRFSTSERTRYKKILKDFLIEHKFSIPEKEKEFLKKLDVEVFSRIKGVASTNKKFKKYNIKLKEKEIHDLLGFRIIVDDISYADAFRLAKILIKYGPFKLANEKKLIKPYTIRDYTCKISKKDLANLLEVNEKIILQKEKKSGYKAIHLILELKGENKPFEIQIRTDKDHDEAENGRASHGKYKKINQELKKVTDKLLEICFEEIESLKKINIKVNKKTIIKFDKYVKFSINDILSALSKIGIKIEKVDFLLNQFKARKKIKIDLNVKKSKYLEE